MKKAGKEGLILVLIQGAYEKPRAKSYNGKARFSPTKIRNKTKSPFLFLPDYHCTGEPRQEITKKKKK